MELINRYIYAVTKDLPAKQREDINKELKTLIDDMVEEYEGTGSYEEKVKMVLLNLGDPEKLADNYRGSKRYLIGPQYFDKYITVLKIVSIAVFTGITISTVLGGIFSPEGDLIANVMNYFGTLFIAIIQAMAWVTLGFVIAERKGVIDEVSTEQTWNLSNLPQVPQKEAKISRVETSFGLLFSIIFITIIYFYPQLFAFYLTSNQGGTVMIPIFDLEVIREYKALFGIIFLLTIAKEAVKLISGRWNIKVATTVSVISLVALGLTILIFINPNIWNPSFASELAKYVDLEFQSTMAWAQPSKAFLVILVIATMIEIATALYKGFKYNKFSL